jgi:PAS domain S-box-containing protein
MDQRFDNKQTQSRHPLSNGSNAKMKLFITCLILALAIAGLYILSRQNYPLFHSIVDTATVFIATGVFVVVWTRRRLLDNHYYLFVGISFLFFGFLDFLHLLGNKNIGVFPEYGNLGPALYIASRYVLSISLVVAPLFIRRKINTSLTFAGYSVVAVLLILSIFYWQNFPVTYIEGIGLTSFKVISDYIICFFLLGAIGLLWVRRQAFDPKVLRLIIYSLVFSIATGLAFTAYTDPFGLTNAIGHFLQIASFYLVYSAFINTVLIKPQDVLYRNLQQSKEEVIKLNTELEKVNLDLKQDITERKQAEKALKESERKLIGVLESMPDAFVNFDTNLRYTYINANAERLQAVRREELLGEDVRFIYPDAESYKTISQYEQVIREQKPLTSISYHAGFDRWVEIRAFPTPDGVSVFYKDVSAQVKAEQALRDSEEKFRSLAENIPDIVTRYDRDLRHIFANTEASKAAGIPPEAFIGKTNLEIGMDPEQVEFWTKHIRNVFVTGKPETMEFPWNAPDGPRFQQTVITPEFDTDGSVKTVLCVTHNLTELKRTEEALRKYTSELEAVNKELEAFSYSVSHDLRAPLRTLDGFSEMILEDYGGKLDEAGKDYLVRIRKASHTMSQLIDDILKLSRISRAEMYRDKVNLSSLVKSIVEEIKTNQPERQAEFIIVPETMVEGDKNLLQIALRNLLENAWKYTGKKDAARIEFGCTQHDEEKVYFIRDNGIGFDMQYKDKLFQPFQRLHTGSEYPGTGIGLATVQRVIRRHNGRIWAESEIGKGTTFYFTLE